MHDEQHHVYLVPTLNANLKVQRHHHYGRQIADQLQTERRSTAVQVDGVTSAIHREAVLLTYLTLTSRTLPNLL